MKENKNEIILFENQNVKLEVNVKEETVWLTQAQMSVLFNVKQPTLSEHINNIFKEGELDEITSIGTINGASIRGMPLGRKVLRYPHFLFFMPTITLNISAKTESAPTAATCEV